MKDPDGARSCYCQRLEFMCKRTLRDTPRIAGEELRPFLAVVNYAIRLGTQWGLLFR